MTQSELYDVVFYGEIQPDFTAEQVKQEFSSAFKLSPEKVDEIFSARRVRIKKGLSESEAKDYQNKLARLGAVAAVEPVTESASVSDSAVQSLNPQEPQKLQNPQELQEPKESQDPQEFQEPQEPESPLDNSGDSSPETQLLAEPKTHDFVFHGSGGEYFKIWIVNILLSIITLGIYSAWAKVRNKQYFYGNTELNNSRFEYLASPVRILKGRVIAFALVVTYSILSNSGIVWVSLSALALMFLASPFFVQRSLLFNARYSAYRNVRFNFDGSFKEAALIFAGIPLLFVAATLGVGVIGGMNNAPALLILPMLFAVILGVPYLLYRQKTYWAGHSMYGTSHFQFSATKNQFLAVWGKLLGWSLLVFTIMSSVVMIVAVIMGASAALLTDLESNPSAVAALLPMLFILYLLMGLVYVFPYVFFVVRYNNLVFNHSRIEGFQLQANYELWSYGKLVLVNLVLTIITLGFFRPWAMVRTARYKADHTRVIATTSMDGFVDSEVDNISAFGEEVGAFYDLDFGF